MTRRPWKDSLGVTHLLPADILMKGGPAAFTAPPPPCAGAFRLLVDELRAFRERRRRAAAKVRPVPVNARDEKAERQAERIANADHMPTIRQRPGRPAATGTVRKSFSAMTAELNEMINATRARTALVQRETAISLLDDLASAARAGRLGSIEAAKVDALRHQHATALGLTATGIRS